MKKLAIQLVVRWLYKLAHKLEGPYRQWISPPVHPGCRCLFEAVSDDEVVGTWEPEEV